MAQFVRSLPGIAARTQPLLRLTQLPTACAVRQYKRSARPVFKSLWCRRIEAGPPKERHRAEWLNWNRGSEIYAFGNRLGEEFSEAGLNEAFVDRSYVEQDLKKRTELGVSEEEIATALKDNTELSDAGESCASDYIKAFLRHAYPALPEEGISSIGSYLMSDATLAHIGRNIGMKDLILCDVLHASDEVVSRAFKAVIGVLQNDQNVERAQLLVQDLIITQLVGKDINEMWDIVNPMGLLEGVLAKQGQTPEPRLLWAVGSETVEAAYMVGIYCDKKLVGKAPGETVTIAEEMAARAALKSYFGTSEHRPPLPFGDSGRTLPLNLSNQNVSTLEYMKHAQLQ